MIMHVRKGLRKGNSERAGKERPAFLVVTVLRFVRARGLWMVPTAAGVAAIR
jgi:hypothetical protein